MIAIVESGVLAWAPLDEGPMSLARNAYEYMTKVYVE